MSFSDDAVPELSRLQLLKIMRILGAVGMIITLIALVSIFFDGDGVYGPKEAGESLSTATVTSLGYGYAPDSVTETMPKDLEGQLCFIKLEDYDQSMSYPAIVCQQLKVGSKVEILSSGNSVRLNPDLLPIARGSIYVSMFFAALFFAGATTGTLMAHRKIRRSWDDGLRSLLSRPLDENLS